MTTNQPTGRPAGNAAKTWLLIGLIVLLAVMVPVGLYFISTIPFTNGTTGSNLAVPDTGPLPPVAAPANNANANNAATPKSGATARAPRPAANPETGKSMALLIVDDETKQPIGGLTVMNSLRNRFRGRSDSEGKVSVPIPLNQQPQQYFSISVTGKGYIPKALNWATYDSSLAGEIPTSCTMTMEKGTKISGKIVDDAGQPVAGAIVLLDFQKKYANAHERIDLNLNYRSRSIKSAEDGTWSYNGAPKQCDVISMSAWDYKHVLPEYLNAEPYADVSKLYDGTATYVLRRGVTLDGVVTGPDGSPLAGASVGEGNGGMASNVVPPETTDSTGKFSYQFEFGRPVILTIQARGCAPELRQLTMGAQPQSLSIALTKAHRIFGRVVDANGNPVPNARFNVASWKGMQAISASFQSDASGNFHWNEAPADPVSFYVSGRATRQINVDLTPDKESVVTLGAANHIRGTVTDAETGQPIEDFKLVPGILFGDNQQVNWQPGWNVDLNKKGSSFDFTDEWPYPGIAVRIEAKGHLPLESRVIKPDEGNVTLDLKMKPGKDVTATIHAADGSLVSGAIAVMGLPQRMVFITDSSRVQNQGTPQATSGADGVVDFPPQSGNFKIVVLADAGYAEVDQDALAKSSDITLTPWGRVEGKLMIGSSPGAEKQLALFPMQQQNMLGYNPDLIQVQDQISAHTDADGKFSMDRVPPGRCQISRLIQLSGNASGYASLQSVDVEPGKTVELTLGGTGRPVVGKVVLPPSLSARTDWRYGFSQLTSMNTQGLEPPPIPMLVRMLPQEKQEEWMRNWVKTDDGKAYLAKRNEAMGNMRNYPIVIQADGTFHVDDVPAGQYQVTIDVRSGDQMRGMGDQLAVGGATVTVPDMPGGRSDEPLQLDPINLATLGKYQVGDAVYDLPMRTTEGKDLKISDFRGKYLLLNFANPMAASLPAFKQIYGEYPADEKLALLTLSPGFVMAGQTPGKMGDYPWHQASLAMAPNNTSWAILNTNFGAINQSDDAWLIGPDGKVVAENLTGDAIQAAVTAAIGPPAAQPPAAQAAPATQPATMP